MSDLTATNCGCDNGCGLSFGNGSCGCNILWIIILLCACGGNGIGDIVIQARALVDGLSERSVNLCRQLRLHHPIVKNEASKVIRYRFHKTALSSFAAFRLTAQSAAG